MTVVELRPVRRWIRRTQAAHRDRGETAATAYVFVFSVLVLAAMAQETLAAVFSPLVPSLTGSGALAWAAVCAGLIFATLRRLGPVTVSRPAAYFLLTAPVSRRRLLSPTLAVAAVGAALAGAATALGILGHAASTGTIALTGTGAVLGVLLTLAAALAQARPRTGRIADTVARLAIAAGLATLVAEEAGWTPPTPGGWPPAAVVVPLTGLLTVVAAAGLLLAVRDLARTPNDRILESAKTAGTLADSVYGVEPSFLADMLERRYWAHRRLRSTPLPRRLPPLTGQDLLLARRRLPRLLWAAAATTLPLLLSGAPAWLLAGTLLIGTMVVARTTTAPVRTDATNPVLLRLLGLTSRQALWQRLWVPAAVGTVWATLALGQLQLTGALPPGQWWPLGLALGPVGAIAGLRAARTGLVRNDLLPFETPMGSVPTGPLLHAFAGLDLLILALPTVVALVTAAPATWSLLLFQLGVAVVGTLAYMTVSTSPERVELAAR
ncbi:DUF6297 family protein [Actinoplanes sp. NPDC049802]|uniref:DUF6297 family protein n=1 Tax=Actinoplanes sp. NPDC049802 TaxID=3154742 RepID=UPI0033C8EE3E